MAAVLTVMQRQDFFLKRKEEKPAGMGSRPSPEALFPQSSEGKCAEGVELTSISR